MQLAEKLKMSGFRLHLGGTFDYEHLITYVEGTMIDDCDIEPATFTLHTLNRTIDIVGYQGLVFTIYYCKPGVRLRVGLYPVDTEEDVCDLVLAWKKEGSIEIYVEHNISNMDDFLGDSIGNNGGSTRNDPKSVEDDVLNPDEESDEEWLKDVDYASEHENDELNEYMENAKQYVRTTAKPKNCKRNIVEQLEPDSDSGSKYSVGMDYEDNDDLNWSMTDEEDLDVDVEELRQDAGQDPTQFREALVENSIESGHPFKYWKNFGHFQLMIVSNWFKKDLYCDLYQNYLPNPMKVGRYLWPSFDLKPLSGPPPKILLGRPRRKKNTRIR
ncbi:hypothetical protein ACFE04_022486 [Oxalis oulophora]